MRLFKKKKSKSGTSKKEAKIWENLITLNSDVEPEFKLLESAAAHYESDGRKHEWTKLDFADALKKDTYPIPATNDREGYYGSDHFSYWASGLLDTNHLLDTAKKYGVSVNDYLDVGCASGRVLRHMALENPKRQVIGCDINRLHVEWCNEYLPQNCMSFQNHSVPALPLDDKSIDLISAYSVFTHIEALETGWLMELKRILRPNGLAWITVHTEHTLKDMKEGWPLWNPVMSHPDSTQKLDQYRNFEGNRLILRWLSDRSYSSNIFYKLDYLKSHWGRIFEIVEVRRRFPSFQDVLILRRR